jgi:hypothetical protein
MWNPARWAGLTSGGPLARGTPTDWGQVPVHRLGTGPPLA